jgi:menaquinone-specific isochorismate synthase
MSTLIGGAKAEAPLVARTVPLADPGPLLALLPREGPLAWLRRGEGLVGWGNAATIPATGSDRFADAERAWARLTRHAVVRDEVGLPGTGPVAFGSFAFSPRSSAAGG